MWVGVLGPLSVLGEQGQLVALPAALARLTARLVVSPNRAVSVGRLVEALWGEHPPAVASGTLRAHVSKLRAAIGDPQRIVGESGGYRLVLHPGECDVGTFEQTVAAGRRLVQAGDTAAGAARFEMALGLWRGPVLAGLSDAPWVTSFATPLEEAKVVVIEEMAEARLVHDDPGPLAGELETLTEAYPYRERLWKARMLALYRSGRQAEALQVYRTLRRGLAEELGLEPAPDVRALESAILRQDPALTSRPQQAQVSAPGTTASSGSVEPDNFPVQAGSSGTVAGSPPEDRSVAEPTGRHNLPVQRSSFVGRADEVDLLAQLVRGSGLVTLTGPGGCGKTRLALQVAACLRGEFPQGVFFVDLSTIVDGALVGPALAAAMRLQLNDSTAHSLAAYLAGRRTLIVLDNCEHLLDACADLAEVLLCRCPDLHVAATSREALRIEGERIVPVPSLKDSESVELFIDRALAVRPDFQTDTRTEALLRGICRRLDGIPLAIEMAAARVGHLTPDEIAEHLDDRFRLLIGGRRRAPRQQTLAGTLDWSHDLLDDDEKALLRRLAVFRGSFDLRSAQEVCGSGALDGLASLVAKSLVNPSGHAGATRYRLLESLRLYAEEKLQAAGERDRVRTAHRDWFLRWIEAWPVQELVAHGGGHQLDADAENLSAALDWSWQQGRYDLCARMACRMIGYWSGQIRLGEMASWCKRLDAAILPADSKHRALAYAIRMRYAWFADQNALGRLSAEVLNLADVPSWIAVQAWAMRGTHLLGFDPEGSDRAFEKGRRLARSEGLPLDAAMWASWYGALIRRAHGRDEILAILDRWLTDIDGQHPPWELVGMLALIGETERAVSYASTLPPATLARQRTKRFARALIASALGDRASMIVHLSAMTNLVREYAIPLSEGACLVGFAKLAIDDGDFPTASRLLATVKASASRPFRNMMDVAVYEWCVKQLKPELDLETLLRCRSQGAAISTTEALDAELARHRPFRSPASGSQ